MIFIAQPHKLCSLAATSRLVVGAAGPVWIFPFAGFRGALGLFGVKSAFLAAADAAMRPKSFEDHFRGGCCGGFVLPVADAEVANMLHESRNPAELLEPQAV